MTAVGGPHPPRPGHDGADAVPAHQPLDTAAAHSAALGLQLDMDTRAAIASAGVAMNPPDMIQQVTVGGGSRALQA